MTNLSDRDRHRVLPFVGLPTDRTGRTSGNIAMYHVCSSVDRVEHPERSPDAINVHASEKSVPNACLARAWYGMEWNDELK